MRKLSIRLVVALLTFILGSAATTAWFIQRQSTEQQVRLSLPNAHWEQIFFRHNNQLLEKAKLPSLRTVTLSGDDLEIRTWMGGGSESEVYGVILRRSHGKWSATRIHGIGYHPQLLRYEEILEVPKSGWGAAWARLVNAGVLTLPDASEIQCNFPALDGAGYVVEINLNKTYRTYGYSNPTLAKCEEAKQILRIEEIIEEEFGWMNPESME
ncbi:MAG TPA: hypothetical protein VIQ24_04915 [Pyrinomonadaceae bacterium]